MLPDNSESTERPTKVVISEMHVAARHAEFHDAGDLLAEADAARTVDAAGHLLHRDQRADVLVEDDALFFLIT